MKPVVSGTVSVVDSSVEHLVAEMARIDARIKRAVLCWQLAGQDQSDTYRGLYVSDAQANELLERPFGANWGNSVVYDAADMQRFREMERQAELQARAVAEAAHTQGHPTRLSRLVQAFDLDRFDLDILLICLAPAIDLRYEKIYGYLQDDVTRKRPGVNLILDLLCPAGLERLNALSHFAVDAALFKYHLLERFSEPGQNRSPLLSQSLLIDETMIHWLLGYFQPSRELAPYIYFTPFPFDLNNDYTVDESATLKDINDTRPLFIFSGPDRLAQQTAARKIATLAKDSLLTLDLTPIPKDEISATQAVRMAFRDARLTGAILFVQGWDAVLEDRIAGSDLMPEIIQHPGIIILAGQATWQLHNVQYARRIHWREFPILAYAERKILWSHYLKQAKIQTAFDLSALAEQFALTSDQIRDAVTLAVNRASQRGIPLSISELIAEARTASSSRLSSLARKVPPRYSLRDIVLPDDQIALLQEIVATVRGRSTVLEDWGVGHKLTSSLGVSMLFAGPPGTGKTLAAQIMSAELGLDLYKIDLSTIISKYIGETEKNLERIFTEAESSNAILFFDEADALFGKRSEVRDSHDRYANVEISYLLQRMEAYNGISILATNLRANLDEAFTRRLQFAVDFPFPEEADRLRIWQQLFPPDVPRAPELDLPLLAQRFKLAGGNIRNIIVSAAYLASANGGMVTMEHLLHGTRRELQKMGRLVAEEQMTHGQ